MNIQKIYQTNTQSIKNASIFLLLIFIITIYFLSLPSNALLVNPTDTFIYLQKAKLFLLNGYGDARQYFSDAFPMGFPIVLALITKIFGENFNVFAAFSAICSLLSAGVFFYIFKTLKINKTLSALLVLFYILNPLTYEFARYIMSDLFYIVTSSLCILFFLLYQESDYKKIKFLVLGIIFLVLGIFIRKIGVTLIAAFLCVLVDLYIKKRRIMLLITGCICALLIGTLLWKTGFFQIHLLYFPKKYTFPLLLEITKENKPYCDFIGIAFSQINIWIYNYIPFKNHLASTFLGAAFLSFVLFGYIRSLFNRTFMTYYVLFYSISLFFFNAKETRYLLPILPFLGYYFFIGIYNFLTILLRKTPRSILGIKHYCYAVFIFLIIINTIGCIRYYRGYPNRVKLVMAGKTEYIQACKWIKDNDKAQKTVLCREPGIMNYFCDKEAYYYPFTFEVEEFHKIIIKKNVGYIISNDYFSYIKLSNKYLDNYIKKDLDNLHLAYQVGQTRIYEVLNVK